MEQAQEDREKAALELQITQARTVGLERDEEIRRLNETKDRSIERQRLRRVLDSVSACNMGKSSAVLAKRDYITRVEADVSGPHTPITMEGSARATAQNDKLQGIEEEKEIKDYSDNVKKSKCIFEVRGMSWLPSMLEQTGCPCTCSKSVDVAGENYMILYHPMGGHLEHPDNECFGYADEEGEMGDIQHMYGTLAVVHTGRPGRGVVFNYTFFVHDGSDFVQWGKKTRVSSAEVDYCGICQHSHVKSFCYGPDVLRTDTKPEELKAEQRPGGIFGLSFKELLKSNWVHNDTLCVKVELEVQTNYFFMPKSKMEVRPLAHVPPPSLSTTMLHLLEEGTHSDVTFLTEGQRFAAHAAIVCSRSEVFAKELSSGMRESREREVEIVGIDPLTFKALLRFLYTDDFTMLEDLITQAEAAPSIQQGAVQSHSRAHSNRKRPRLGSEDDTTQAMLGGGGGGSSSEALEVIVGIVCVDSADSAAHAREVKRMHQLQSLLQAAHRYQIHRLQRWCEQQLCGHVQMESVCTMYQLAHQVSAGKLEHVCLEYMTQHFVELAASSSYLEFGASSPALVLKFTRYLSGIPLSKCQVDADARHEVDARLAVTATANTTAGAGAGSKRSRPAE
jgi:speckle-type POZ protein